MKKKILLIIPVMLLALLYFVGDVDAGSKTLNLTSDSYTLQKGNTLQLKINGVKAKKVKWATSNKKVATVSKNGVVKGVNSGNATISGKYRGITFNTKITVKSVGKSTNENANKSVGKLLCEDNNISVTLKEIKNGKIYITVNNKSKKDYWFYSDYVKINDELNYNVIMWEELYAGLSKDVEIVITDKNGNDINYNFKKGSFAGQFEYYNANTDAKKLKFDININ